jgi:hypothetical protein
MRQPTLLRTVGIRIVAHTDGYAVTTPYDESFIATFKAAIPSTDRKWDKDSRAWIVSLASGAKVQQMIEAHFGTVPALPQTATEGPQRTQLRILDLRYLGATKARDDGSETAFGWCDGGWNAIFPKTILLTWFGQEQRPDESPTLYGVLGLRMDAKADDIKKAHRRLARQWHPDISREPGTVEQFHAIQEAYEILSSSGKRARYDAGLKLEGEFRSKASYKRESERPFRAPDRCGLVLVEGVSLLGRFVVSQIHSWQDITNSRGQVLVTSWPMDAKKPVEDWVEP